MGDRVTTSELPGSGGDAASGEGTPSGGRSGQSSGQETSNCDPSTLKLPEALEPRHVEEASPEAGQGGELRPGRYELEEWIWFSDATVSGKLAAVYEFHEDGSGVAWWLGVKDLRRAFSYVLLQDYILFSDGCPEPTEGWDGVHYTAEQDTLTIFTDDGTAEIYKRRE